MYRQHGDISAEKMKGKFNLFDVSNIYMRDDTTKLKCFSEINISLPKSLHGDACPEMEAKRKGGKNVPKKHQLYLLLVPFDSLGIRLNICFSTFVIIIHPSSSRDVERAPEIESRWTETRKKKK